MAPMFRNVEKQNGCISHVRKEESEWDEDEQESDLEFPPTTHVIKHVIEIQRGDSQATTSTPAVKEIGDFYLILVIATTILPNHLDRELEVCIC